MFPPRLTILFPSILIAVIGYQISTNIVNCTVSIGFNLGMQENEPVVFCLDILGQEM